MKKHLSSFIFQLSAIIVFLFVSCEKPNEAAELGHALRVIVYYQCDNYSSNIMYPGAPNKDGYGIYQVILKLDNNNLTDEILDQMNTFVTSSGIKNFSGNWYSDSELITPLTAGPLTSKWEDNYYNYFAYTQINEDLTPRFTEWIIRDTNSIYRFGSSNFDIYPLDTSNVNFDNELRSRSYSPFEVGSVYYIDSETNLIGDQWHPGDPLQGKKIFVDLTTDWSKQKYDIKFINTVTKSHPFREPYYNCVSRKSAIKVKDYLNGNYEYKKFYKGSFSFNGDITWNKDEPLADDDTIELYDLIRIDTCQSICDIYIIDENGVTDPLRVNNSDITYEFKEDDISNNDLGDVGQLVYEAGYMTVNNPNSSYIPKAYYRLDSSSSEVPASTDTVWEIKGYTYIQIKKGCRTSKLGTFGLEGRIYILVESLQ